MMLWSLFALLIVQIVSGTVVVQSVNDQNGGQQWGSWSLGYFNKQSDTTLDQDPTAVIHIGNMSSMSMLAGSQLQQSANAVFSCGQYTEVILDELCNLQMGISAYIQPNATYGAGRMEIYCNGAWSMMDHALLHLEPQSLINITAQFSVGSQVNLDMRDHSALVIHNSLIMQDAVLLTLMPHSLFEINTGSGAIATISASRNKGTYVYLADSSRIVCNGSMTVGAGQQTEMILQKSGSLLIGPQGEFTVAASTFEIGPSSFWIINGVFFVDGSGTLRSQLQSNITISGSLESTNGGNIDLQAGTTTKIGSSGQLSLNGNLVLMPSSQLDLEGKFTMFAGSSLTLSSFSGFSLPASTSLILTPGSSITIGSRSNIAFAPSLFCTVSGKYVLGDFQNLMITANKKPAQFMCFPSQ